MLSVFIMQGCWILSCAFSYYIEIIIWFLSLILLMSYDIDFCMLNSLTFRVKSHLVITYYAFCMLLDMICITLQRIFVSTLIRYRLIVFLWRFWDEVSSNLSKWIRKCSLLYQFLEEFIKTYSLNIRQNLP